MAGVAGFFERLHAPPSRSDAAAAANTGRYSFIRCSKGMLARSIAPCWYSVGTFGTRSTPRDDRHDKHDRPLSILLPLSECRERAHNPGEILLEEFLRPMGITQVEFAQVIDVPLQRVN